jgi:23S rRNA (uracil1939-C5)-methyltransferase
MEDIMSEWKKNDRIEVVIEDISETGEGIGKTDGFTWFIKDTVIGDRVEAKVMKTKKSYGFARLEQIVEMSKNRVEPKCPVARQCGGCQLQAMDYEEQLRFKERKIYNNLMRIGGFSEVPMLPIIGMDEPWRYRNKAQFPWGTDKDGNIVTGFYAGRTHSIIRCEDCLLGIEENQEVLKRIKAHMEQYGLRPYDEATHKGLMRHTLIRKGFKTGELMVCQVINGKSLPHSEELVKSLMEIPGMASISFNVNKEQTNVIMGSRVENLYGPGYITDYIGDVKYRISPLSFYQVNPVQTEKLYGTALEYAGLTGGETVWDLYCGIGTISLFLAKQAKKVYGVEVVPQAIDDARENARLNGIDNVEFFVGKAEEVLPEQFEKNKVYADVIVVDPPRKGCDEVCLDTIVKMAPKRVVYVSCDSATLARDLKYLAERGYEVMKVRGCDMFPHSGHVETIVLLQNEKRNSNGLQQLIK